LERLEHVVDLLLLVALLTQEVLICHVEVPLALLLLQCADVTNRIRASEAEGLGLLTEVRQSARGGELLLLLRPRQIASRACESAEARQVSACEPSGLRVTGLERLGLLAEDVGTGVAKGAILTQGNIVANMLQARAWIKNYIADGQEILITPLPLYHIFSLTANCFIFNSVGALNILITNPRDIPGFVKELQKWKFTAITGVNTLFNGLLNNEEFRKLDFSHLKVALGGGMAVQKSVAERWKQVTGKPLVEAYGLTETSPAACINPMTLKEYNGLIGLPIPSTDVEIKDDNGKTMPLGEIGEICIKGPQVMKGYWNKPEETAKVMTNDGFFKTGDLGYMNEQGYVKIVDRKKDMILVSGFNVYPNELEDVITTHPKVLEAAAIGIPDDKSGEVVKVFIVKKDESLTQEELMKFCRDNLTSYKIPKSIEFRKELPKSNVGKILRKDLRAEVLAGNKK
jgi:long-chain acyl-CoA synthetase